MGFSESVQKVLDIPKEVLRTKHDWGFLKQVPKGFSKIWTERGSRNFKKGCSEGKYGPAKGQ